MAGTTSTGTVREALAVRDFRRIYIASFLSNSGRWMQTAALGVLAWEISESSAYLGAIIFAQLGPLGILSLIGGSLADTANRRTLLLVTQLWQMLWTFGLAAAVIDGEIGQGTLWLFVFVIGLGQGIYAPAFTSVLPSIAGPGNLRAAIALNSVQVNGARVIGPAIGGFLTSQFGFAEVFAINAASYIVVLAALVITPIPEANAAPSSLSDRMLGGFRVARRAPQVGRPLALMCLFSFCCLPFLGQLPAIAEVNLGVESKSTEYGWFYAAFGMGALVGAALVATVLLRVARRRVIRGTLWGFAAALAWLSVVSSINLAYLSVFLVGLFYFVLPTTLSTAWQEHVDETVRGRVAAIWVLSFGGTVPFANILAGPIIEVTSLQLVMGFGVVAALALGLLFRVQSGPVVGEEILAHR